jgi:hypothetical protein
VFGAEGCDAASEGREMKAAQALARSRSRPALYRTVEEAIETVVVPC